MITNQKAIEELELVIEVCSVTALAEAAQLGIKALQGDWHYMNEDPPEYRNLIVAIKDDRGDKPTFYTTEAWLHLGGWISDNNPVCGEVYAWKYTLDPPDYKSEVDDDGKA